MFKDDKFNFWCPIGRIEKATDEAGEPVMRIGGIASTMDKDADGEYLDPTGFDIEPLKNSGMVNWHHQAKNSPAAIIGEPSKVELRPEGLWIESDLYASSPMANEVYELAKTLEEDSKTRRLGYSIEGKVVKRASNDKKSPLYNKIVKAVITGVAVTHMPKNPHTFVNIIKGQIDADGIEVDLEEEDDNAEQRGGDTEKKALTTSSGAALMPESVDGQPKKTFSKSSVMECIFRDIPNITIPNAQEVYTLIKNISVMNKRKSITSEDIEKAYDALGLNPEGKVAADAEDVQKGDDADGQMGKEDETHDDEPRHNAANMKNAKAGKKEESEEETEDDDEGFEQCDKNGAKMKKAADNDLMKAIQGISNDFKSYIKATAVLVNDLRQKRAEDAKRIAELEDVIKGQTEVIEGFSTKLERYGSEVPRPKSLRSATVVDRAFAKGDTKGDIEKADGITRISMTEHPKAVASLLDQASFAKGYDKEYGDALLAFEARPEDGVPSNIIARLKAETGYEIVK